MSSSPPLSPEVVPPSSETPIGGGVSSEQLPGKPPSSFRTWWIFKKWAWRNTAALIWLLLIYSTFRGLSSTVGSSLPSIPAALSLDRNGRIVALAASVWLLVICELQLTQLVTFAVYVAALPFWLPGLAGYHYFRNRLGSVTVKASRVRIRALRVGALIILGGVYLWWPLPSRQVALVLGIVALVPGFLLLRRTFRFCVAPGVWTREIRVAAHKVYETMKMNETTSTPNMDRETSERLKALKALLIAKYESSFLGGIERGILRKIVVLYFCALVLACLLYRGFAAALLLRAFTDSPEALASALGRKQVPDLLQLAARCSLGVLGESRIDDTLLPPAGAAVVVLLRLIRDAAGIVFTATFFGGYSADIARAEAKPSDSPGNTA